MDKANFSMRDSVNAIIVCEYASKGNPAQSLSMTGPMTVETVVFDCSCTLNNKVSGCVFVIGNLIGGIYPNIKIGAQVVANLLGSNVIVLFEGSGSYKMVSQLKEL